MERRGLYLEMHVPQSLRKGFELTILSSGVWHWRLGELGGVICNNVCIKRPDVLGDSGDNLEQRHPCPDYSSRDAQCFQNISSS